MNRFFHLYENPNPKIQSVFRFVSIIMVAAFAAFLLDVFLAIRTGSWLLWCAAGSVVFVLIAMYIGRRLILAGKIERAAQFVLYSIMILIAVTPFLIADLSLSLSIASIILTMEIASRTERPERYLITNFVVAAIATLLDLVLPDYRPVVPALQIFAPIVTGTVLVVLGVMVIRSFQDYSLRIKMIIVILTLVMISVATIAFVTNRSLNTNLTETVGINMSATANSVATEIADVIDREISTLKLLSLDETVQFLAENASLYNVILSQAEIEELDSQWRAAYANNDDTSPLVASVLYNRNATPLWRLKEELPQNVEIFLTDQQGLNLATTGLTSDYYQADEEWWQVAFKEGVYVGQPEYDESSKVTAIIIAIAVRVEGSEKVVGILRTTVILDSLVQALDASSLGQTGQAVLYLPNGQELTLETKEDGASAITMTESEFDANALKQAEKSAYFETDYNQAPVFASQTQVAIPGDTDEVSLAIANLGWHVIVFQDQAEALQPVNVQTRNIVVLAFVIFITTTFAALGLAYVIAGPLIRLNAVAEKVAAGDLSIQAQVETGDETGALAETFNSMTAQLRDLVGTLERRVADRTKALATSAEVSRNLSTIMNERQLIIEVVEQLKAAFDYYHVHIYLVDEASGDLIMAGGTGDVGAAMLASGHKIPKGKGLVGRAAQTSVPVLVLDTSKDPAWLPNPLLPETRCEAALPIATGDKVLGVLDVQENEINGLTIEDFRLLQSLTSQIAIALLNARSYVDVQQRAERETHITSIGLKIKNTTSIEGALEITARELGRVLGTNDIRVILESPGSVKDSQKTS